MTVATLMQNTHRSGRSVLTHWTLPATRSSLPKPEVVGGPAAAAAVPAL